jgi:hypothetical protein
MKIWSKGLGTMVLLMDFRNYYVEMDDRGDLLIKGRITDPVFWNFVITVKKDDIKGLANIAFKPRFLVYLLKNVHWVVRFFYEKLFRKDRFLPPEENIEIVRQ